jgi:hypothetical protein
VHEQRIPYNQHIRTRLQTRVVDSDGDTEKRAETGGAKGVDETAECEYSRHPDNEQRECTNGDACLNCTSAAERGG